MKCLSNTNRGHRCTRNGSYNGYCFQHVKNYVSTEENRETIFQVIIDRYEWNYTPDDITVSRFQLSLDYYKKQFLEFFLNYKYMLDNNDILSTIHESSNFETIFSGLRDNLTIWYRERKNIRPLNTLENINYLCCMREICKVAIYFCIQKRNNTSLADILRHYKSLVSCLSKRKENWKEECIKKLCIKEVKKCNVMCDDVFKHVFLSYY